MLGKGKEPGRETKEEFCSVRIRVFGSLLFEVLVKGVLGLGTFYSALTERLCF